MLSARQLHLVSFFLLVRDSADLGGRATHHMLSVLAQVSLLLIQPQFHWIRAPDLCIHLSLIIFKVPTSKCHIRVKFAPA
jgi:hypothetical protein